MRRVDEDSALLVMFIAVGVLPLFADLHHGRRLGVESTIGLFLAAGSLIALFRRTTLVLRAQSLGRRLLFQERSSR